MSKRFGLWLFTVIFWFSLLLIPLFLFGSLYLRTWSNVPSVFACLAFCYLSRSAARSIRQQRGFWARIFPTRLPAPKPPPRQQHRNHQGSPVLISIFTGLTLLIVSAILAFNSFLNAKETAEQHAIERNARIEECLSNLAPGESPDTCNPKPSSNNFPSILFIPSGR